MSLYFVQILSWLSFPSLNSIVDGVGTLRFGTVTVLLPFSTAQNEAVKYPFCIK